jgi:hypothetical protein
MAASMNPGGRIVWDDEIKWSLAKAAFRRLQVMETGRDFTDKDLFRAFKEMAPVVLKPNLRRNIGGLSHVPWLREMVTEKWDIWEKEEKTAIYTLKSAEPSPAPPPSLESLAAKLDAVLDSLRRLEERLNVPPRAQVSHAAPATLYKAPSVRVGILGTLYGDQGRRIRQAASQGPLLVDVVFCPKVQQAHEIPQCHHLIIMEWVQGKLRATAMHLFAGRYTIAKGMNEAISQVKAIAAKGV